MPVQKIRKGGKVPDDWRSINYDKDGSMTVDTGPRGSISKDWETVHGNDRQHGGTVKDALRKTNKKRK